MGSVAWDVIRIRHGWSSSRRLDRVDRKLTIRYRNTLRKFEDIDRQVKAYRDKQQSVPSKLDSEHHDLLKRIETDIHQLIVDEIAELMRDINPTLKHVNIIYTLLESALKHSTFNEQTKERLREVIQTIEQIEKPVEELTKIFTDDFVALMRESAGGNKIGGTTVLGEEMLLRSLRRRDRWKFEADAKLHQHSEIVDQFVKKLEGIHNDNELAERISSDFKNMDLSNFKTLTDLMKKRVELGRNVLHYYINLYHKFNGHSLSEEEINELHRDERKLGILFRRMYPDIENTIKNLEYSRRKISTQLLRAA